VTDNDGLVAMREAGHTPSWLQTSNSSASITLGMISLPHRRGTEKMAQRIVFQFGLVHGRCFLGRWWSSLGEEEQESANLVKELAAWRRRRRGLGHNLGGERRRRRHMMAGEERRIGQGA
jgi:hypothetical protein